MTVHPMCAEFGVKAFASLSMCMILQPNQLFHRIGAPASGEALTCASNIEAVARHFNRIRIAGWWLGAHSGEMVLKSLEAASAHWFGLVYSLLSCTRSNNGQKFP